jgi:hypothetical protein
MSIEDTDNSNHNITVQDEQYFEEYIRQERCSECGEDHRFKPSFNDVKSSIDHAFELLALFINR